MEFAELVAAISAAALAVAEISTQEEIELLAAVFTQLGDTLATIALSNNIAKNISDDSGRAK